MTFHPHLSWLVFIFHTHQPHCAVTVSRSSPALSISPVFAHIASSSWNSLSMPSKPTFQNLSFIYPFYDKGHLLVYLQQEMRPSPKIGQPSYAISNCSLSWFCTYKLFAHVTPFFHSWRAESDHKSPTASCTIIWAFEDFFKMHSWMHEWKDMMIRKQVLEHG